LDSYIAFIGCTDPRLSTKEQHEARIGWLEQITGADHVIFLNHPNVTHWLVGPWLRQLSGRGYVKAALCEFAVHYKLHGARTIVFAGHTTCGRHPCKDETHREHVLLAAKRLKEKLADRGMPDVTVIPGFEAKHESGAWSRSRLDGHNVHELRHAA
jgi:hypothetical protein